MARIWRIEFEGAQSLYVQAKNILEAITTAQEQAWMATGRLLTVVKAEQQQGE